MKETPMTFQEFIKKFSTEEQCREYLFALRFPNGFVCPKCAHNKYKKAGNLYTCKSCQRQTSVTAGTVFHGSRKPLTDWFAAIWWTAVKSNGTSACELQRVLGLSYETAFKWRHIIRSFMVETNEKKLSGNIEVYRSFIGGESTWKLGNRTPKKVLIIVAAELIGKRIGGCRISKINDDSEDSINPFIIRNIEAGSTVITDDWKGNNGIENMGFSRITLSQKTPKEDLFPHVHMIVSLLKCQLLGTYHGTISEEYLQSYLDEFVYHFNRRETAEKGLLFYNLIESAVNMKLQ